MSDKTRKRFSPMLLVISLAAVGVMAAFIALAAQPGNSEAHGPDDHENLPGLRGHDRRAAGDPTTTFTTNWARTDAPMATATATATA